MSMEAKDEAPEEVESQVEDPFGVESASDESESEGSSDKLVDMSIEEEDKREEVESSDPVEVIPEPLAEVAEGLSVENTESQPEAAVVKPENDPLPAIQSSPESEHIEEAKADSHTESTHPLLATPVHSVDEAQLKPDSNPTIEASLTTTSESPVNPITEAKVNPVAEVPVNSTAEPPAIRVADVPTVRVPEAPGKLIGEPMLYDGKDSTRQETATVNDSLPITRMDERSSAKNSMAHKRPPELGRSNCAKCSLF